MMQPERRCHELLLLDGALGTYLEDQREPLHPLLWSSGHLLSNPNKLLAVHEQYLSAGADIVTSASYQISYEGFATAYGYSTAETNDCITQSIEIARRAISQHQMKNNSGVLPMTPLLQIGDVFESVQLFPQRKFVAASIGTYGAHLADGSEYHGQFGRSIDQLRSWHYDKLKFTVQQKPDFLALETIPCLDEVRALQQSLGKISEENQMPVAWMTVACNSHHTLNSGENIEDFCRIMEDSDVASSPRNCLIGVNCTHPQYIDDILQLMTDSTSKQRHFIAYPNRGDSWNECLHCYENDPDVCINLDNQFVAASRLWVERYPRLCILGGCCRTHPNLIRRLKEGLGCY